MPELERFPYWYGPAAKRNNTGETMSHTPGPWEATRESNGWDVSTVDYIVAECGSDVGSRANARLIAAAPDLLAALRTLLDAIEGKRVTVGDCNEARFAIARAEGK